MYTSWVYAISYPIPVTIFDLLKVAAVHTWKKHIHQVYFFNDLKYICFADLTRNVSLIRNSDKILTVGLRKLCYAGYFDKCVLIDRLVDWLIDRYSFNQGKM